MYVLLVIRRPVMSRIVTATLVILLSSGGLGLCAGWDAAPEARMACCVSGDTCPMHESSAAGTGAATFVSQAQADSCCAASERDDSTPSASAFVPVVSRVPLVGPVAPAAPPTGTPFDVWRGLVPRPGSQVPKHLLLSVFLI